MPQLCGGCLHEKPCNTPKCGACYARNRYYKIHGKPYIERGVEKKEYEPKPAKAPVVCKGCGTPYEKPNAECKTCRDREKHRGNSIVKPRKCSAGGCPIENLKPGCKTCSNRNKNRKFSGRPLLTPLPIPEPPPAKPRPVLPLVVKDPGLMSYLAARRERLGKRKENKKND